MATTIETDWWLMTCSFPDLNWARRRVFDNGRADVFDCDGSTHDFASAEEAQSWLREDEFDALASMDAEELAEHNLVSVCSLIARRHGDRLAGLLERRRDGEVEADPSHARLLLVSEDRFAIRGRGLVVVPGPELPALPALFNGLVELHRPDGTRQHARVAVQVEFSTPTPQGPRRWSCTLPDCAPGDVPLGTELWLQPKFSA